MGKQGDVGGIGSNREPRQQRGDRDDRLGHGEVATNAAPEAASEREVGVPRAGLLGSCQARGIKLLWFRPEVRTPVGCPRAEQDDGSGRDAVARDSYLMLGILPSPYAGG